MADNNNPNSVDYQLQIARQYGAPLDKYEVFATYEEAEAYANSPIAYAGQLISVVDGNKVNAYKIMSDKSLVAMDAKSVTMSDELPKPDGIASAGTSEKVAHGDHVHQRIIPTATEVGALPITGGNLEGTLMVPKITFEKLSTTRGNSIIMSPQMGTSGINAEQNCQGTLKFICENYYEARATFCGAINIIGLGYIWVYVEHTRDTDASGLPNICNGWFFDNDQNLYMFSNSYSSWNFHKVINDNTDDMKIILNKAYPVGSIYMSTNSTSPASLFCGSWTAINGGAFLKAITSGSSAYENQGLPNITGAFYAAAYDADTPNGAFYQVSQKNCTLSTSGGSRIKCISFNASDSNVIYGNSSSVTPYNYGVHMWRRTA